LKLNFIDRSFGLKTTTARAMSKPKSIIFKLEKAVRKLL